MAWIKAAIDNRLERPVQGMPIISLAVLFLLCICKTAVFYTMRTRIFLVKDLDLITKHILIFLLPMSIRITFSSFCMTALMGIFFPSMRMKKKLFVLKISKSYKSRSEERRVGKECRSRW